MHVSLTNATVDESIKTMTITQHVLHVSVCVCVCICRLISYRVIQYSFWYLYINNIMNISPKSVCVCVCVCVRAHYIFIWYRRHRYSKSLHRPKPFIDNLSLGYCILLVETLNKYPAHYYLLIYTYTKRERFIQLLIYI